MLIRACCLIFRITTHDFYGFVDEITKVSVLNLWQSLLGIQKPLRILHRPAELPIFPVVTAIEDIRAPVFCEQSRSFLRNCVEPITRDQQITAILKGH